jgi:SAM-dependent methyltransferase
MDGHPPLSPPECGPFPANPMRGLVKEVLQDLSLEEADLLVDLSCGDGRFAGAILDEIQLRWQIIGVQASRELLLSGTGSVGIRPVPMDLEAFARFPVRYHKALLRSDFLPAPLPRDVLARLFHQLIPGGRIVVVEPAPAEDMPLPAATLRRWEARRLDPDEVVDALGALGAVARRRTVSITCHTPARECLEWFASRAWPVLADVPDAALAADLREMREQLGGSPAVTWTARFDVVTGVKVGEPSPP